MERWVGLGVIANDLLVLGERALGHGEEKPRVLRWDAKIEDARTDGRDECRNRAPLGIHSSTIISAPGSS